MHDPTTPIERFVDAVAARRPTPGGGSVAALTGALAAAMGEMVVNYSLGRKGLEAHQNELKTSIEQLRKARSMLLGLMVEDQAGYDALTAARKLPESDPQRAGRFAAALLACIRGPQSIAAAAAEILRIVETLVDRVNPWLLSDLAVCADLAMATCRSAGHNVRVNLCDVADESERMSFQNMTDAVLAHALERIQRISPRIWARHAASRST